MWLKRTNRALNASLSEAFKHHLLVHDLFSPEIHRRSAMRLWHGPRRYAYCVPSRPIHIFGAVPKTYKASMPEYILRKCPSCRHPIDQNGMINSVIDSPNGYVTEMACATAATSGQVKVLTRDSRWQHGLLSWAAVVLL